MSVFMYNSLMRVCDGVNNTHPYTPTHIYT